MKMKASEMEKVAPVSAGTKFFALKNDGDTCRVRVLFEKISDVNSHCVHSIKLANGFRTNVECLKSTYDDPDDVCPLCNSSNPEYKKTYNKFWLPLYKVDEGETCMWERGLKFWKEVIGPLMVKVGTPFCGHIFTIERNGEAGSVDTTYEFLEEGFDDTVLDDFDEIPTEDGHFVFEYTYDQMENFLKTGSFEISDVPELPRRRTPGAAEETPQRRGVRPNMV